MRTIELTAKVTEDGKLVADLPPDISQGSYRAVLVIGEQVTQPATAVSEETPALPPTEGPINPLLKVQMIEWDTIPEDTSFGREELYDDVKY
jgi:hypothetical protein